MRRRRPVRKGNGRRRRTKLVGGSERRNNAHDETTAALETGDVCTRSLRKTECAARRRQPTGAWAGGPARRLWPAALGRVRAAAATHYLSVARSRVATLAHTHARGASGRRRPAPVARAPPAAPRARSCAAAKSHCAPGQGAARARPVRMQQAWRAACAAQPLRRPPSKVAAPGRRWRRLCARRRLAHTAAGPASATG